MRGAVIATALAMLTGACATTPGTMKQASAPPQTDYRNLTCGQLAQEIARTQRAYASARAKQFRGGETAAAFYVPISLSPQPDAQAGRLGKRLEGLQRASRAKRCASTTFSSATA